MNNILKNYIEQKKPTTLTELARLSGIDKGKISRASNSKRWSVDLTLELAIALKDNNLVLKGYENGKLINLTLQY